MTKEQYIKFFSSLIWGYVFIHININLGPLDVFPDWIGYLLIYSTIVLTKEFNFYNAALRPLSLIMALWTGLLWIFPSLTSEIYFIKLIINIIDLYLHFNLLTLAWNLAYEQGIMPGKTSFTASQCYDYINCCIVTTHKLGKIYRSNLYNLASNYNYNYLDFRCSDIL